MRREKEEGGEAGGLRGPVDCVDEWVRTRNMSGFPPVPGLIAGGGGCLRDDCMKSAHVRGWLYD
jgi:hypothetical protein